MVKAGEACDFQAQLQRHLRHRLADRQGGDALTQRVLLRVGDAPAGASQVSQLRHTDVSRRKSAVPRTCCPCEASNAGSPRSSGTGWPAAARSRPPSHAQRARPSEKRGGCQCRARARVTPNAHTQGAALGFAGVGTHRQGGAEPRLRLPGQQLGLCWTLHCRVGGQAGAEVLEHSMRLGRHGLMRRLVACAPRRGACSERLPACQCRRLSPRLSKGRRAAGHTRAGESRACDATNPAERPRAVRATPCSRLLARGCCLPRLTPCHLVAQAAHLPQVQCGGRPAGDVREGPAAELVVCGRRRAHRHICGPQRRGLHLRHLGYVPARWPAQLAMLHLACCRLCRSA